MDKKDEIILQQLEVIRSMTEHSLKSMGDDLFGKKVTLDPESPFYIDPKKTQKTGKGVDDGKGNIPSGSGSPVKNGKTEEKETGEKEEEKDLPPEKIEDLKAELASYIGLESVKKEVNNLINMVNVHNMRKEAGLPVTDLSLHMVFSGNPGTGKSTVARIMARIYHSLGILSRGHLVEVDRAGLVAGYVGQTAIKTREVLEKSKGGLLFVDEAYTLSNKSENDFGQEAIDTILKGMEDNREDLVVIVAGYDKLMDDFIHSNPGLESRFNRYLHFDDYSTEELSSIFRMYCKKGCYALAPEAEEAVKSFIEATNSNSISFGNARGVRNLFEHILVSQANRLALQASGEGKAALTKEQLMEITKEDVEDARRIQEESWSPEARTASDRGGSGAKSGGEEGKESSPSHAEQELKTLLTELSQTVKNVPGTEALPEKEEEEEKEPKKGWKTFFGV